MLKCGLGLDSRYMPGTTITAVVTDISGVAPVEVRELLQDLLKCAETSEPVTDCRVAPARIPKRPCRVSFSTQRGRSRGRVRQGIVECRHQGYLLPDALAPTGRCTGADGGRSTGYIRATAVVGAFCPDTVRVVSERP
jgi:hypothetical protein